MRWTDVSGGLPATDSIVRLCSVTDSQCGTPQTDFITSGGAADAGPEAGAGWFALNEQGHVEVMVPYGFDGFFEFVSTQYAPTYRFTAPALRNERNLFDQYVLRSSEIRFLAAQAFGNENAFEEKDHAIVILFARDCFQNPVGSASFTTDAIDPLMKSFVLNGSTPSTTDTKTDAAGRGGFLNVPVQGGKFHTFTGYYEDPTTGQKKKLGSARAFVRPGAAVSIAIAPTP